MSDPLLSVSFHAPKPRIVCVDFDGCLASYRSGYLGLGKFGDPIPGAAVGLQKLKELGYYIVIYTVRGEIKKLEEWLQKYGMVYDSINWHAWSFPDQDGRKIGADLYICDRSLTFCGNWIDTIEKASVFRQWEV